jgi:N-acetylmuramic acid 6-phosphate (MurNAc-6-P) etherase
MPFVIHMKIGNEELYKETNEKYIERVEHLIYEICGCSKERAKEVLEECLKRNKIKIKK